MYTLFAGRNHIHYMYIRSRELNGLMQKQGYNQRHHALQRSLMMPKQDMSQLTNFGRQLATLRKKAGYTQVELAKELDVTQRMISYYEGHSEYPPASLLPKLAKLLGVSADELLGIKPLKKTRQPDTRLQRRLQQIEKLSAPKKRQILQVIDTFIENEQLKQQAS